MRAILAFSSQGLDLARRIQALAPAQIYHKDLGNGVKASDFGPIWEEASTIIFVGASGIAVRYIAPYVAAKDKDPAVLVLDDGGLYVISLLSGHLGGANREAQVLAGALGARAIITTASDARGFEAPDLFAKRLGYRIEDLKDLAPITGLMVEGQPLGFYSIKGEVPDYPNLISFDSIEDIRDCQGALIVTDRTDWALDIPHAVLRPPSLHLGLGAREGADFSALWDLLNKTLREEGLALKSIRDMASIDIKAQEPALLALAQRLDIPFRTFEAGDLRPLEASCQTSDFVRRTVGVGSVSCPAALALGGRKIVDKVRGGGFTLSITREE